MSASTVDLSQLLSVAVDAARLSGKAIREIFESGDLRTQDKAGETDSPPRSDPGLASRAAAAGTLSKEAVDPQTLADTTAQQLIIRELKLHFPSVLIIGEEGELKPLRALRAETSTGSLAHVSFPDKLRAVPASDVVIWLDPLDGTKEFVQGHVEMVTTLIGIAINGKAVAGVIHQPFMSRTVWGCVGAGVHGLVEPIPTLQSPPRRIMTTSRSHYTAAISTYIRDVKPRDVIKYGGAGGKTLLVLRGQADVYAFPSAGTKKWDVCACDAVLRAAGGLMTDLHGEDFDYSPTANVKNLHGVVGSLYDHQHWLRPEFFSQSSL